MPVGSAWVFVGCVAGPGRAQPACACSGGGVVRNSDPRDRREDAGNSLLQPVAMAAYFREASKGGKKKKKKKTKTFYWEGRKIAG